MQKIKKSSLVDIVYQRLKAMILEGSLAPGSRINKLELAETLAISATPINEAINRLAGEKLIEQRARQGFFVREYDDKALADLFAVRAGLESTALWVFMTEAPAAALARLGGFFSGYAAGALGPRSQEYLAEDMAFHRAITEGAAIPLVNEINQNYGYVLKTYEHGLVRPPEETLDEHRAIIAAIRAGDASLAARLLSDHHLRSRAALLARVAAAVGVMSSDT